jgi:ankyrin repeat protein
MKLKEWNYCKYRTNQNKAIFRGKRKRSSATSQEQYRPEHRTRTSLPLETTDLCTPPPPTSRDVQINGSTPEQFPARTSSRSTEEYQPPAGLTLHEAVKLSDTTSIDKLLQAGVDIHAYDGIGFQALHYAVSALWNASDQRMACSLATQLLSLGADAASVTRPPAPSNSPLHLALWSTKLLKILLRSQVDPNVKDLAGDTPLHRALHEPKTPESGTRESLKMLLEAGADPSLRNNAGETPFQKALKAFRVCPVDIPLVAFVEKGADVNAESPEIGFPFQALAEYFRSKADWPSDHSVVRERRSWETALHSLLLRTSTTVQGEAVLSTALPNLATHCLGMISVGRPSESLTTLTIALCQRLATDPELTLGAGLPILPVSTPAYYLTPGHPFPKCMSILLASGLYRRPFKRFEIPTDRLDQYLYMILTKNPGPTDCDATLGLLSAGADPFGGTFLDLFSEQFFLRLYSPQVNQRRPLCIYLTTKGVSCSLERRRIVQILLRQWISQVRLTLAPEFWTSFADRCQTGTWEPPNSPESIPGVPIGVLSREINVKDRRVLWEIMVEMMADECLSASDLERTKNILRDVRKMGIDLKPEWMDLLLDRD